MNESKRQLGFEVSTEMQRDSNGLIEKSKKEFKTEKILGNQKEVKTWEEVELNPSIEVWMWSVTSDADEDGCSENNPLRLDWESSVGFQICMP